MKELNGEMELRTAANQGRATISDDSDVDDAAMEVVQQAARR